MRAQANGRNRLPYLQAQAIAASGHQRQQKPAVKDKSTTGEFDFSGQKAAKNRT
jgi:hypothetical protein